MEGKKRGRRLKDKFRRRRFGKEVKEAGRGRNTLHKVVGRKEGRRNINEANKVPEENESRKERGTSDEKER